MTTTATTMSGPVYERDCMGFPPLAHPFGERPVASARVRQKLSDGRQGRLTAGVTSAILAQVPGRLAQWESTSLTRKGSLVQSQYRPPYRTTPARCAEVVLFSGAMRSTGRPDW